MKRLLLVLSIIIVFIISVLVFFSKNIKLELYEVKNELKYMFVETEYLNLEFNNTTISKIAITSSVIDISDFGYTSPYIEDNDKIKAVIKCLNTIPLKPISREDVLIYSPDTKIYFMNDNDDMVEQICLYSHNYIEIVSSNKVYNIEKDDIIELIKETL